MTAPNCPADDRMTLRPRFQPKRDDSKTAIDYF
jgi:hypothetical protein